MSKNVSFNADEDLVEDFDEIIFQKKAAGELDRDTSRSDILRDLLEDYVEGNGSTSTAPTATAD